MVSSPVPNILHSFHGQRLNIFQIFLNFCFHTATTFPGDGFRRVHILPIPNPVFSNRKMSLKGISRDGSGSSFLNGIGKKRIAAVGAVGMWETRSLRFPRKKENPDFGFGIFLLPSFPLPSFCGAPQLLEELLFGLLHALCGFGVAEGCGYAFQHRQTHSRTQILSRPR